MSIEFIVISAIVVAFSAFAVTLAWAD